MMILTSDWLKIACQSTGIAHAFCSCQECVLLRVEVATLEETAAHIPGIITVPEKKKSDPPALWFACGFIAALTLLIALCESGFINLS